MSVWGFVLLCVVVLIGALGVLLARPVGKRLDVRGTRLAAMGLALAGAAILLVRQFV